MLQPTCLTCRIVLGYLELKTKNNHSYSEKNTFPVTWVIVHRVKHTLKLEVMQELNNKKKIASLFVVVDSFKVSTF